MRRWLQKTLAAAGALGVLAVALQFTPLPYRLYRWLGDAGPGLPEEPDYIVLLGGGGIPSESGLMRSYVAAEEARRFPNAMVAVAMTDSNDVSTVRMLDELEMRGVKRARLLLEDRGRNTREQAVNLARLLRTDGEEPMILLVTSTEHMRRAAGAFRRAGFVHVSGTAAEPVAITADLTYRSADLGASPRAVPDVGGSLAVRYTFWSNGSMTGRSLRELCALAYYRLQGWL